MKHTLLRTGLTLALAAAAVPALALGLGQIQVKSQPGQPLLAEIPIISSDPAELQGLQVQMASPDTFRRVGLEPPQGEAASLHFEPALDAQGRPVIRVTSPMPVQQPLLTFLVEVDWGEGRLVREYSALVDAPRTVAAPAQPPIEAPAVAPPNAIVREPLAPSPVAAAPAEAPVPTPAAPTPTPVAPAPAAPAPGAVAANPPPTPAPAPAATAPAVPREAPDQVAVQRGDTLGGIAADLGGEGYSLDQAMLALLRANPEAFIGGNINRLKQGAVLRVPAADEIARQDAATASTLVREQVAQWREARKPALQPAADAVATAPTPVQAPKPAAPATRRAVAGARLEIVPPSPDRKRQAGTESGIEAGGEGEMLKQQLQETKETLAARDAEVGELKARVAELEKLRQQQDQLLTMKDTELAAAQRNLAQANRAQAAPATAAPAAQAATQQPATTAPAPAERPQSSPWLWGGVLLVAVALVGWLLSRRKRPAPVRSERAFDTAALAASIPQPAPMDAADDDLDEAPYYEAESEADVDDYANPGRYEAEGDDVDDARRDDGRISSAPDWTRAPAAIGTVPTWHAGGGAAVAPAAHTPAEQLERARAYLDLGDDDSARELLREVLDSRDPAAREAAARLLREL